MKYTKTLVAATLLATCALSQAVLAKDAVPATPSSALASGDLSFAFGQSAQSVQVATLSEQEMKETEGANIFPGWTPQGMAINAGWGAIGGFSSYWGQYSSTRQWNTQDMFRSVAGGAIGGLIGVNRGTAAVFGAGVGGFISNYRW